MLLYSLILKLVEAMTSIKIIITCGAAVLLLCVFDFSVFTACLERTPGHYVPSASARNPPRPILASENPTACITQSVCLKVSANGCVVLFQPIFCPCFMLKKKRCIDVVLWKLTLYIFVLTVPTPDIQNHYIFMSMELDTFPLKQHLNIMRLMESF